MSYDIDDKTTLYSEARKLAFSKALAQLGEVTLSKPISISDQVQQSYPGPFPMMQANIYKTEAADMAV
jgi:uncharacterized protein YggE